MWRAHVVIDLVGTPAGVRKGGVLDQVLQEVEIECLPKDLPAESKVDVSALEINESIRVGQLAVADGVKIHTSEDETVATVKAVKVEEAAPAEDAAAAESADTVAAAATETK